jgi:hypothetical protein
MFRWVHVKSRLTANAAALAKMAEHSEAQAARFGTRRSAGRGAPPQELLRVRPHAIDIHGNDDEPGRREFRLQSGHPRQGLPTWAHQLAQTSR